METAATAFKGMHLHYRSDTNTVVVTFPIPAPRNTCLVNSEAEVTALFAAALQFWRSNCESGKAYWVIDYQNFDIDPAAAAAYQRCLQSFMNTAAVTIVRHGGSLLQRSIARSSSQTLHVPAHLYTTREEALEVVAGLQAGFIRLSSAEPHWQSVLLALLLGCACALTGCSYPSLSDAGKQVALLEGRIPPGCQELAQAVGHASGSVIHGDSMTGPAEADLRNQAALWGATHVSITLTDPSAHACRVVGIALKCPVP